MSSSPEPPAPASRRGRILITGLIVLGLALVLFFGLRAARSFMRIHPPGLKPGVIEVEAMRGWMTIPYIAKAYRVP
ncbi:MAG: hypothetical protein AB1801_12465 [Chloroflexota bacterium]